MAKKQYLKLESWNWDLKAKDGDRSVLTIKGQNSNRSEVEITVSMHDYEFPHIIKQMAVISRDKLKLAQIRLNSVKQAVEE